MRLVYFLQRAPTHAEIYSAGADPRTNATLQETYFRGNTNFTTGRLV
jgi:hypothetical protein